MELNKKLRKVLSRIDRISPRPVFYPLRMSKNEVRLFDKEIKDSIHYLEFGMGGSTFRALMKSKTKIYSIESSKEWIDLMKKYLFIRLIKRKRLSLFHIDIGTTGKWGYPTNFDSKELFPNFSALPFQLINKSNIDTVLIDGRFRVACTLKTILECNSNKKLKILIHDFHREKYHIVLKYLDKIDSADTLFVFKLKLGIDLHSVAEDFEKYKYTYD